MGNPNKFDSRQVISRDTLNRIAAAAGSELDNILRAINVEVTPLIALTESNPASLVVNVGASVLQNPETGRNKALPTLGANTPNIASGSITFPAASGGTITITPGTNSILTVASGNWVKALVYLDGNDNLNVLLGDQGASESAATTFPAPDGTMPIGYISIHNVGGVIQPIPATQIYQYTGVGAPGGGAGDDYLAAIRDMLLDSVLDMTAYVSARTAKATALDGASTASYNIVNNTYKFSSIGQTVVTAALLPYTDFLAKQWPINKAAIAVFWRSGAIDAAATYELSRNGGTNWQPVTVTRTSETSDAFQGWLEFDKEYTNSTPLNIANTAAASTEVNITTTQKVSQQITLASATRINTAGFELKKTGAPDGNYRVAIYGNSAGSPDEANKLWISPWVANSSLTTSLVLVAQTVGVQLDLAAGTYHIVLETDAAYKATFTTTTKSISLGRNTTVALNQGDNYNGTAWSGAATDYAATVVGKIYANQTLNTQALDNTSVDLNTTTAQALSQAFTVAASSTNEYRSIELKINKATANAVGRYKFQIVKDNAGSPSLLTSDVVAETQLQNVTALSTGANTKSIDISWLVTTGTYHIVVQTDAAYKAQYTTSAGVDKISMRTQSGTTPDSRRYNGTDWSNATGSGAMYFVLKGITLDLRLRITSSAANVEIPAFGVAYHEPTAINVTGLQPIQSFDFSGNLDSTDFVVNNFTVDANLVKVFDVYEGKVYKYGIFSVAGNRIIFPAGFFLRPGQQVRLIVEQMAGSNFDSSNQNAQLLAQQHFASPPGSNLPNFGLPGRGFCLMGTDGQIYECVLRIDGGIPTGWDFFLLT